MQSHGHSHVPGRVRVGCSEEKQGEELLMRPKKGEKNSWGRPGTPGGMTLKYSKCSGDSHCFILSSSRGLISICPGLYLFIFLVRYSSPPLNLPASRSPSPLFFPLISHPSTFLLFLHSVLIPPLPPSHSFSHFLSPFLSVSGVVLSLKRCKTTTGEVYS